MSKLSKSKILFLVSLLTMGLVSTAHSSFIKQSEATSELIETIEPVCYVTNSSSTTYYTDIDKALVDMASNTTSDTLYVIPSLTQVSGTSYYCTNITMDGWYLNDGVRTRVNGMTHTINSGDTLCLPIEGTTYYVGEGDVTSTNEYFADRNASYVNQYRRTLLNIASGVTLNVNGALRVGGIFGRKSVSSVKLHGATSDNYCEINLGSGATIVANSGSTVELYGYIKESSLENGSTFILNSGSTLTLPLVFYDFNGVTILKGMDNAGIFPLSLFDFPNTQVRTRMHSGATLNVYTSVYMSSTGNLMRVSTTLVTSTSGSGVIRIKDNSYIEIKYNSSTFGYSQYDSSVTNGNVCRTNYDVYGGIEIHDISITVAGQTIATNGKMFPITYKMNLNFHPSATGGTSTSDFYVQIKILPGSKMYVHEGATVNLHYDAAVVPWSSFAPDVSPYASYNGGDWDGKLYVGGTLNTSTNGRGFGGEVLAYSDSAVLNIVQSGVGVLIDIDNSGLSQAGVLVGLDKSKTSTINLTPSGGTRRTDYDGSYVYRTIGISAGQYGGVSGDGSFYWDLGNIQYYNNTISFSASGLGYVVEDLSRVVDRITIQIKFYDENKNQVGSTETFDAEGTWGFNGSGSYSKTLNINDHSNYKYVYFTKTRNTNVTATESGNLQFNTYIELDFTQQISFTGSYS